jgi:hypothetical protein
MKLPALKARHGTFHRQDVLSITKPAEGLKGGEVGIFWDQEIGLEILRRVNAYPKLVEALHSGIASLEQFVALGRIPENNQGLREMRAILAECEEGPK